MAEFDIIYTLVTYLSIVIYYVQSYN